MGRPSLRTGWIPAILAVASAAFAASSEIVAHAAGGAEAPVVLRRGNQLVVERSGGSETLDLPAGAEVENVRALGASWLVSGEAPDARGTDLVLLRGDAARSEQLPAPPGRVGRFREGVETFTSGDRLLGVAWVEGEERRSYEVRFAPWQNDRFGAPEVVAPRGPGSQLALAGVRFEDGRLLLVWAGFDGTDDEIWGAIRSDDRWSKPVRVGVDNSVPDITPAVALAEGGAWIAWSRFDGSEYRLAGARFDGTSFHDQGFLAPAGTLFPTFEATDAGPALLYLDARSDDWVLSELAPDGRLGRSARSSGHASERPQVSAGSRGVTWRFAESTETSGWP